MRRLVLYMAIGTVVLAFAAPTLAANRTWDASTSTDWFTGTNWSGDAVPMAADNAIIDLGATAAIIDGAGAATTQTQIGTSATGGALVIRNGGTLTDTEGSVGRSSGSNGTATVEGAGSAWISTTFSVGHNSIGQLTVQDGATISNSIGYVGRNSLTTGSSALITGEGSSWTSTTELNIGLNGADATMDVLAGADVSATTLYMARNSTSTSTLTLDGTGTTLSATTAYIGNTGDAVLNVENGADAVVGTTNIAFNTTSEATATITGAGTTWQSTGGIIVGRSGIGTLNILSGAVVTGGNDGIATGSSSSSTVNVSGAGSLWSNTSLVVGDSVATGTLAISNGGTVTTAGTLTLADAVGSTGTLAIGAASGAAVAAGTLNADSVTFGAGTGSIVFNHTGTDYEFALDLIGAGTLNAVAGVTRLTGDLSTYTGSFNATTGTFEYAFGADSTINAVFAGNGAITIDAAGTTELASNSSGFTGTTTISAGSVLDVSGQLGGDLSVATGSTLQGTGTVGDVVLNGTVAPGNSIGTLNVAGNVTFNAPSVYEVELNAAGASDLIDATGSATLNGGTVSVLPEAGSYTTGQQYTILTAAGGVTGTFDGIENAQLSLFREFLLNYDATHAYLTLSQSDFASVAASANQSATAAALQSLGSGNALYDTVLAYNSVSEAQAAYNALSGEAHASVQSALLGSSHAITGAIGQRLNTLGERAPVETKLAYGGDAMQGMINTRPRTGLWMQAYGGRVQGDATGNTAAYRQQGGGTLIGVDMPLQEGPNPWYGGMAIGYGQTQFEADARGSDASNDHYHAALYAGRDMPAAGDDVWRLRSGLSLSRHAVESERVISVLGITDRLYADYLAHSMQLYADAGYSIPYSAGHIEPFMAIAYDYLHTDGFTEQGGATALRADGSDADTLSSTLGLRLTHRMQDVKLHGMTGWKHAAGDLTPDTTMTFASGGNGFTVQGAPIARDAFVFSLGAIVAPDKDIRLQLGYDGQLSGQADAHGVHGRVSYLF